MTTLLIVFGALLLAVLGREILDPLPPRDEPPTEDQVADDHAQIVAAISLSAF